MSVLLTLNAGSSSLKFAVYAVADDPDLLMRGQVENLGPAARLVLKSPHRATRDIGAADHAVALRTVLDAADDVVGDRQVIGVGHRVVHGGTGFSTPVEITDAITEQLHALVPLAPLHQPNNLRALAAAQAAFPDARQVACFDTGFHHGHPFVNDAFAIPRRYYDEGVRRYGFHGLSYEFLTGRLRQDYPELARGRVVIAHLGNGASMCAVRVGQSIGSTMGFTALDGLPMGTRCGQLDPGVLLYLLEKGMSVPELSTMLYRESGLKGLSGISRDMRTLLASDAPEAAQAIDYYVFRIRRELGAMSAVLGGLDAVVFAGGIGENAAGIRARVLDGMDYLGLRVNAEANARNDTEIHAGDTAVLVIPTDEERVIARATARVVAGG